MLFLSMMVAMLPHLWHCCFCFLQNGCTMRDVIFACLDVAACREGKRRVICRIRDDADDRVGMARLLDFITIKAQQGFTF